MKVAFEARIHGLELAEHVATDEATVTELTPDQEKAMNAALIEAQERIRARHGG